MGRAILFLLAILGFAKPVSATEPLYYERAIDLDAETLAEFGIKDAYQRIIPVLNGAGVKAQALEEHFDDSNDFYTVAVGGRRFSIYENAENTPLPELWGNATFVFFKIINDQLDATPLRFYALNGGNDLMGIMLTPEQAEIARKLIDTPRDWPYLPTQDGPWYGQSH